MPKDYIVTDKYISVSYTHLDVYKRQPLTTLVWITSILSIIVTFVSSYFMIGPNSAVGAYDPNLWSVLAIIISCGTLGGAVIPEITKVFTSPKSKHVQETVTTSKEGGASLNILSGLTSGNFSAFWIGMVFFGPVSYTHLDVYKRQE